MKKVISFGNSKDNYSSGGRIINREMTTDEIFKYLDNSLSFNPKTIFA